MLPDTCIFFSGELCFRNFIHLYAKWLQYLNFPSWVLVGSYTEFLKHPLGVRMRNFRMVANDPSSPLCWLEPEVNGPTFGLIDPWGTIMPQGPLADLGRSPSITEHCGEKIAGSKCHQGWDPSSAEHKAFFFFFCFGWSIHAVRAGSCPWTFLVRSYFVTFS